MGTRDKTCVSLQLQSSIALLAAKLLEDCLRMAGGTSIVLVESALFVRVEMIAPPPTRPCLCPRLLKNVQ